MLQVIILHKLDFRHMFDVQVLEKGELAKRWEILASLTNINSTSMRLSELILSILSQLRNLSPPNQSVPNFWRLGGRAKKPSSNFSSCSPNVSGLPFNAKFISAIPFLVLKFASLA